ncbi:MAG: polysaccharide deacetylase family protein [Syntrophales bacterium]
MRGCRTRTLPFLSLLIIIAMAAELPAAPIADYRPVFLAFIAEDGKVLAATRRFQRGDETRFLVLDPERFDFREMASQAVLAARPAPDGAWRETPFARALARLTAPPFPLQNDGLREAEHPVPGFFLTADLCPSQRPLDRGFFAEVAALPLKKPLPVALAVTGSWVRQHPGDLAWLKGQAVAETFAITWVNHSFNHPYDPAAPPERNFLLSPGIDFATEVLGLERLLIEEGLLPSPFFRFPGLVSNQRLVEELGSLNLIPIGSSAWLAKGERPRPGGIILVHANGNEPEGIRLLKEFFTRQRETFRQRDAVLLPLRQAFGLP